MQLTEQQIDEAFAIARAILGALGNIGDQLERLATEKKGAPSSKRGKS